jgi:hypothetical protein
LDLLREDIFRIFFFNSAKKIKLESKFIFFLLSKSFPGSLNFNLESFSDESGKSEREKGERRKREGEGGNGRMRVWLRERRDL